MFSALPDLGALLNSDDAVAVLASVTSRLDESLREAEQLAPLLLGRGQSRAALTLCAGMRRSATASLKGLSASGEVLSSDDIIGADRAQLKLGRRSLVDDLGRMAECAADLVLELRKRIHLAARA